MTLSSLIPVGGILIRSGIKSAWVLRLHALLQSIGLLVFIVAAALGIYIIRQTSQFDPWEDSHTKFGVAILALAFIQPVTGYVHHLIYKRRSAAVTKGTSLIKPGRTTFGNAHIWLGRALIVAAMANGGLGIRLSGQRPYASNVTPKAIAYGVGTGLMFVLYVVFVVLGERRRSKEQAEPPREHHRLSPVGRGDGNVS